MTAWKDPNVGSRVRLVGIVRATRRWRARVVRAVHAVRVARSGSEAGAITSVRLDGATLVVSGLAHLRGEACTHVGVWVDGRLLGFTPVDPGAGAFRWTVGGGRAVGETGAVTLTASAVTESGLVEWLTPARWTLPGPAPSTSTRAGSEVRGHIDVPANGSTTTGPTVLVEGWVVPSRLVDRVELRVGDGPPQPARLHADHRPDVASEVADPTAVMGAFWHVLELGDHPVGARVEITIEAVHGADRTVLGHREVVIGPRWEEPDDDARRWVAALRARAALAAEPEAGRPSTSAVRLLVFAHDLGVGGAQLWLWEILRRMLGAPDVSCTVVAPADGPLRAELEAAGARVHLCGPVPTSAGAYESKVRELALLATADASTIVLANTLGSFIGVDVAAISEIPSVLAVHEHYGPEEFLAVAFGAGEVDAHVAARVRAAPGQATAVCAVSEATKQLLVDEHDLAPDRVLHIDYGIDLLRVHDGRQAVDRPRLRNEYGFADGNVVVLSVGTVEPRKCQTSLVLAFDRVAVDHPDARLVVVGMAETRYGRGLSELVHALGRDDRIRLVELTPDVVPWYAMADAFVLASDAESLPRVIIEAMALGVPVLSTDVAGVSELVVDGETGLLCVPRDVAALEHGLRRLLGMTGEERTALARRAVGLIGPARDVSGYTAAFDRLLRALSADPTCSPTAALVA
jgi:D-inositol-3-phosphate glycosyltransferase